MAWIPLSQRLNTLPLVLAGPILRRVEQDSVSVWIALKESRELELIVYDSQQMVVMRSPKRITVALGTNLHILLLTAKLPAASFPLAPNETYQYGIVANGIDLAADAAVTYGPQGYIRPTFSLPPATLNDLRIVHASCRKMHADGSDAFVALNMMIEEEAKVSSTFAQKRPHQLFLTGDQIYADDVDGLQLCFVQDAYNTLLGWKEDIYDDQGGVITGPLFSNSGNGARSYVINEQSGFKFPYEEEVVANHLMFLGEYYVMYLLMWSPSLWPASLADYPTRNEAYNIYQSEAIIPTEEEFALSVNTAFAFQQDVALVRRALANVPTYMICDDHEITDDWFITLDWTRDVLSSPLGKRILQNGLTAYALFQAWGNTPERFEGQQAGRYLLDIMPQWAHYHLPDTTTPASCFPVATTYWQSIYRLLGLPDLAQTMSNRRLIPANPALHLTYNYQISWGKHQVIVLDTRNERSFPSTFGPGDNGEPPVLISNEGLTRQLVDFSDTAEVTFLVIATPISAVPNIEKLLRYLSFWLGIYRADGEVYTGQESGIESLYGAIAKRTAARQQRKNTTEPARIIVLSGDVHYGFTNRVEYWGDRTYNDTEQTSLFGQTAHFVLAQLCASALKNEVGVIKDDKKYTVGDISIRTGTNRAHIHGYNAAELARPNVTLGWVPPNGLFKSVGTLDLLTPQGAANFTTRNLVITKDERVSDPYKLQQDNNSLLPRLTVQPDWVYRIDYLVAKGGTPRPNSVAPEVAVDPAQAPAGSALAGYLAAASNAQTYIKHDGYGREAVGKNNLGEIRFSWGFTEDTKLVTHQLWWRLESGNTQQPELPPYPLSEYEVMLGASDTKYPKPSF